MNIYSINDITEKELLENIGATVAEEITNEIVSGTKRFDKATKPVYNITEEIKELCVEKGLIPKSHRDAWFNMDKIIENLNKLRFYSKKSNRDFVVAGEKEYIATLNKLIVDVSVGITPERSYLFGAPNGFGKESFVATCIKLMVVRGMRVAPYISLFELAELQSRTGMHIQAPTTIVERILTEDGKTSKEIETSDKTERYIFRCTIGTVEKELEFERFNRKLRNYSWDDYMTADILFCFFTDTNNKLVESSVLKSVLSIRAAKGLPTIAFISTSVEPYISDENLWNTIWSEIYLNAKQQKAAEYICLDRVLHIRTYKKVKGPVIINRSEEDDDSDEVDS